MLWVFIMLRLVIGGKKKKNLHDLNQGKCQNFKLPRSHVGLCGSRKYPYLPHRRFFGLNPPSPPLEIFPIIISFMLFLKMFAVQTPVPLGISKGLPWGGYGYIMGPRIAGEEIEKN